jgi:hypothetical protein
MVRSGLTAIVDCLVNLERLSKSTSRSSHYRQYRKLLPECAGSGSVITPKKKAISEADPSW